MWLLSLPSPNMCIALGQHHISAEPSSLPLRARIWSRVCWIWTRDIFIFIFVFNSRFSLLPPISLLLAFTAWDTSWLYRSLRGQGDWCQWDSWLLLHYLLLTLKHKNNNEMNVTWKMEKTASKDFFFLDLTGSSLMYLHLKHLSMCKEFSCI